MANWAIVIGVDQYWRPDVCLKGAVNDALAMRDWLLDVDGGDVPSRNLTLLLAPDPARELAGITWHEATYGNIVEAIELMLTRSQGDGERFFFHFSGHGLTSRNNFSDQSAIAAADFKDYLTTNSLTVKSLFELFLSTGFNEQFFFIDACRNMPFETEKRLGEYPNPRPPKVPGSPQFIMFATMRGVKAIEVRQPGSERGAFTGVLRNGLRGEGNAKRRDDGGDEYVVRWNSLFEFVETEVEAMRLDALKTSDGPIIQKPRQWGERGSENPVLSHFSTQFEKEVLEVDLDPQTVVGIAEVVISDIADVVDRRPPPLLGLPLQFQLSPGSYSVRAKAPGYTSRRRYEAVDLYKPSKVRLELQPESPGQPPGQPPDWAFTLTFSDPLAPLELADSSGRILATGRSPLIQYNLAPGYYRGRVVTPEGAQSEELFELASGVGVLVSLKAPPPSAGLLQRLALEAGFYQAPDNTIEPSEAVGAAASLKLSTVLALAAGAGIEVDSSYGSKLRSIGLPRFQNLSEPGAKQGVQVVFGDELAEVAEEAGWGEQELCCWPMDEETAVRSPRRKEASPWAGITTAVVTTRVGPHWLSLGSRNGIDLLVPVAVLPGFVTLVIMTRDIDGSTDLHQYMSWLPEFGTVPTHVIPGKLIDPDPSLNWRGARFGAIRRIELMQRYVASGRVTPTLADVNQLLWDKWQDPIAGCLGGYLLIRMGMHADLQIPARNLTTHFSGLPDSHVLMGAWHEALGEENAAIAAYLAALNNGVPLFRDGLMLLRAAINRFGLTHWRAPLLADLIERVPSGVLWSSASELPASLTTGDPKELGWLENPSLMSVQTPGDQPIWL